MSKQAKRLAGPAQLSGAAATKYTAPAYVPTTLVTQVRKFHFYNADVVPRTVTLSIGADAAGTRLLDAYSIAAGAVYDLYGPHNVAASEIIQAFASAANVVSLTIDGDENV